MFKCKLCLEKDKFIEILREQNTDLHNRLMAFNEKAYLHYKAEEKKGEPLFPTGMDKDGKLFDYKDTDKDQATDEVFRAMGEQPVSVEDKMGT